MILARLSVKAPAFHTFVAPWPCELVSSLPAVQYSAGTDRHWRRIAHVLVEDVAAGDILQCKSCFEVTNDLPFIVELAACLILTPCSTGTAGLEFLASVSGAQEPSNGRFITRCPGYNLTPNSCPKFPNGAMHHGMFPLSKDYVVPAGVSGNQYVAVMAYCGGLNYAPTSDLITVEPWCSDLSVTKVRT